jgi:hypothetical protein
MRPQIKVLVMALATVATPATIRAQQSPIQLGSIQVAGTADFTHTRDIGNDNGWTAVELLPRVGYFVVRGLSVSGNLRFRRVWYDNQETIKDQRFVEWGFGPGLTYYVATRSPRLFPFVSARTLFTRGSSHATLTSQLGAQRVDSRVTNNVWLLSGGALFMVARHVGISGELFYQHENFTARYEPSPESGNSSETYGLHWGISAFIF